MSKEAYVPFETAKLLKEKGFEQICDKMYKLNGKICNNPKSTHDWYVKMWYPCATLQMAMAWLREEHKLLISIGFEDDGYYYMIQNIENMCFYDSLDGYGFGSYEEAVEEALKYSLENLI